MKDDQKDELRVSGAFDVFTTILAATSFVCLIVSIYKLLNK